jgi:hypothetical protein
VQVAHSSPKLEGTDAQPSTAQTVTAADETTKPSDALATAPPTQSPPGSRWRRLLVAVLWPAAVFVVALALSLWYYHTAWVHPRASWIGGQGDPEQQMWFMRWPIFAISHGNNPLLTDYLLYPSGANLMWNGSDIVPGLIVSPVTLIWGPVASYNVLMLLSPPTTALAAYAAFRRWASRLGAALGGLLLAFSPFVMAHSSGHLHLILLALLPVTLLLLDEILVRQSWRWWLSGGLLGLVAAAQLLTSEEILSLEAIFAVVGIIVLAALHRHRIKEKLPYAIRAGLAAIAAFLVLASYPLYVQFATSNKVSQPIHSNNVYVTDLLNPLLPVNQRYRPDWVLKYVFKFTGNGSEWTGYIGLPLLVILITLLIVRWRRPVVLFSAVMGTIALLFSFGPWLHIAGHRYPVPLPWEPFSKVPVLHQIQPGRFSVIVVLFVALGLALAVTEVQRSGRLWVQGIAAVGVALVIWFWIPGWLPTTRVPTPAYFTSSAVDQVPQGSVALVLPYVNRDYEQHSMLWQAQSGMRFRMAEGWAIVPGDHAGPKSQTRTTFSLLKPGTTRIPEDDAAKIRAELNTWHVQTVIIGPFLNQKPGTRESAIKVVEQILGRPPVEQGGVQVWYDVLS